MDKDQEISLAWDEAGRLDALRALKLLDTPAEERFDSITHMAKKSLHVSAALISLVDAKRQWFKSKQGVDASETSRDISFCTHAILQDDIFTVEDALLDPRFAENPLVLGPPHIRFYAGKPLYSEEGKKVGTLCLLDNRPRQFSEEEYAKFEKLAAWAEREINNFSADSNALSRLENRLRLAHALEYSNEGIISTDIDGIIETANPALCQMFHFKAPDLIGKNISILIPILPQETHADFFERLGNEKTSKSQTHLELTAYRKDGEPFPIELSFRKLQAGNRQFFTGIIRDITDRKNIERAKNEFLATVSHELRTPLTSILGAISILKGDVSQISPAEMSQLLDIAYLNSKRLNELINDILDAEKLDAELMVFNKDNIAVQELIEEACKLNTSFATSTEITLLTRYQAEPLLICVDHSRFIQVLTNLISNACKFSPKGETVIISAEHEEQWVIVKVIDNGEGIPDEFRSRIFQRFAQAYVARDREKQGTGLGLSISKTMIEKMGGQIGYESHPDKGATFVIRIPLVAH